MQRRRPGDIQNVNLQINQSEQEKLGRGVTIVNFILAQVIQNTDNNDASIPVSTRWNWNEHRNRGLGKYSLPWNVSSAPMPSCSRMVGLLQC